MNIQVAVDAKNKLIVEQAVTNQVVDLGLLTQTAEPGPRSPGRRGPQIDVVADRGYFKIEDVEAWCERARLHSARSQTATRLLGPREGFFRKAIEVSLHDAGRGTPMSAPAGKVLTPIRHGRLRDPRQSRLRCNRGACLDCPDARATCTNRRGASVSRLENEAVLDRMAERLKKRPEILDRRREVVEHPFGSIKQWMYQGAFLMRGLANVRGARLQFAPRPQHPRRRGDEGRRRGLRRCGSSARMRAFRTPSGRIRRPIEAKAVEIPSRPLRAPLNAQLLEFPHDLLDFCTLDDRSGVDLACSQKPWATPASCAQGTAGVDVLPTSRVAMANAGGAMASGR